MRLDTLLDELTQAGFEPASPGLDPSTEILDVVHDSRNVRAATLFCAVPGATFDGHDFVERALDAGAVAAMVERPGTSPREIHVRSVRLAMPHAAAIVHAHPSRDVAVFGITGTNGKTTTTQILADVLESAGLSTRVIGTLVGAHTTPEAPEFQRELRAAVRSGASVVAAEVSSHALDQHRVDGTDFAVAAFTNLTPDHLDYHGDMQRYYEAKRQLFDGRAQHELISIDDAWGRRLADERPDAVRITMDDVSVLETSLEGSVFAWRGHTTRLPIPGRMNVANALMAAEAAVRLGVDEQQVVSGLAAVDPVPGRMQIVPADPDTNPTVIVDYSHTPDSIDRVLATVREVAPAALVSIVFGCGGDRDRTKRPLMGHAAERGADRVYVTSDNPRSEDPMSIIEQAVAGMLEPSHAIIEPDRRSAIAAAIAASSPSDVIVVAGKGHETTQTIGDRTIEFDDVKVAGALLQEARS